VLAEPRILILGEATSSLDSEFEQMSQQGLSYLMRGRTTFVIAHRLSTFGALIRFWWSSRGKSSKAALTKNSCAARTILRSVHQAAWSGEQPVSGTEGG